MIWRIHRSKFGRVWHLSDPRPSIMHRRYTACGSGDWREKKSEHLVYDHVPRDSAITRCLACLALTNKPCPVCGQHQPPECFSPAENAKRMPCGCWSLPTKDGVPVFPQMEMEIEAPGIVEHLALQVAREGRADEEPVGGN